MRKPFDPLELLTLLEQTDRCPAARPSLRPGVSEQAAGKTADQLRLLIDAGRRRHELLDQAHWQTVATLASSLEIRGLETTGHTERVTATRLRLAVEVAPSLIDDPSLEWGFLLHDVGNIGIPDRILLKPGPLNAEEWRLLQQHTTIGERLLEHLPLLAGEGLRVSAPTTSAGTAADTRTGSPGDEIPLGAQIFSLADALDAMTDRRPHRRALEWESAFARLKKAAGYAVRPRPRPRAGRLRARPDHDPRAVARTEPARRRFLPAAGSDRSSGCGEPAAERVSHWPVGRSAASSAATSTRSARRHRGGRPGRALPELLLRGLGAGRGGAAARLLGCGTRRPCSQASRRDGSGAQAPGFLALAARLAQRRLGSTHDPGARRAPRPRCGARRADGGPPPVGERSSNQKVDPDPARLVNPIRPPWASMISRETARPRPVPGIPLSRASPRKNLVKILA